MNETDSTPITPRWREETLDRLAAVYDSEVLKHGAPWPQWAMLPVEAKLAVIAIYCAGRRDGVR